MGGNLLIIYYLIHDPIRMVLLYLNQSAHIIDEICESDVHSPKHYLWTMKVDRSLLAVDFLTQINKTFILSLTSTLKIV